MQERISGLSLWRPVVLVVLSSVLLGGFVSLLTENLSTFLASLIGSLIAVLPALISWRGTRRPSQSVPGILLVRFVVWWLVKVGLTLVLLALAMRRFSGLDAGVLMLGFVLALLVFWFDLFGKAKR